ncbi:MAG TPA: SHD1 domain-containing protein [Pirellulaceae bacterium]|nr:SHD1 domain-containing protein [Pirellulaceae bacterium]
MSTCTRFAVIVLAGMLAQAACGQDAPAAKDFQVGDKVVIDVLGGQEGEVVGKSLNRPVVKFPFGEGTADVAVPTELLRKAEAEAAGDKPAKRPLQPGDIVTLTDGTKGYLIEFDKSGNVHLKVERGARRIYFPHFARLDKIASIEPATPKVDPRRAQRIWTDITGKFKTEAAYVRVHDGKVELKKADGSLAAVPLNKLSAADAKIAQQLSMEDRLPREAVEPYAAGFPEMPDGFHKTDAPGITTIEPNWEECREVVLEGEVPFGGLTPDPAPAPQGALAERAINIPFLMARGQRVSEGAVCLVFARGKGQALVTFLARAGRDSAKRMVRLDLVGGRMLETFFLPHDTLPVSADADGQVLVGHTEFGSGIGGRVDYFAIAGGEAKLIASWRPYREVLSKGSGNWAKEYRMVQHAAVIDKDHLLTMDPDRRVTVWKAAEAKAIYTVAMARGTQPALSGGGKYLAIAAPDKTVYVLEALTGKPLAKMDGYGIPEPKLSFRPDGKQLASVRHSTAQVWDVTTGKHAHTVGVYFTQNTTKVAWPADGFLLADGMNLLDLNRGILLWHYRGFGTAAHGVFGGRYWNIEGTPMGQFLASTPLPHAEAVRVASALDGGQMLAVKPGMEIALDVRVNVPPAEQQAIRDSLTKKLTANGLKVVAAAPLVLHAAIEAGPPEQVEYRARGSAINPGEKVTVTPQISKVWITENDKYVWGAGSVVRAPLFVDQGAKDLRTAVGERMRPDVEFFVNVGLPSQVIRPGSDPTGAHGSNAISDLTIK